MSLILLIRQANNNTVIQKFPNRVQQIHKGLSASEAHLSNHHAESNELCGSRALEAKDYLTELGT